MSEPTYGKARGSDYDFFTDNKIATRKLENDLIKIVTTALNANVYLIDSFYTILSGESVVEKHCHMNRLDRLKDLGIGENKYSLVYYLMSGDQDCLDPGALRLYSPDENILPFDGMIILFPASRYHSVKYNGQKDRVIIGVNFYCI